MAWIALVVAAAGLAGSLALSWGLGLKACPLCFYQRSFMMAVVAVLGVGLLTGASTPGRLALLALPLAAAGLGVALFHVWLEMSGKLECPRGVLGLGTAPQQSLAAFAVLFSLLFVGVVRAGAALGLPAVGAVVLGGGLALASCTSNPPMPDAPKAPYAKAPDVCRPPYHAPADR
jgi:disulfide bond formation protein DsbB